MAEKNKKFGDISALIKESKGETEGGAGEAETSSSAGNFSNIDVPAMLQQQTVKKTVDISLVYSVAIEEMQTERKRKNRLQPVNKAVTINGILDEILKDFFDKEENRKYWEKAVQELS